MDLYISSLSLGAAGLAAMALSGLGHHGHGGGARGHAHSAHAHSPAHTGHAHANANGVQGHVAASQARSAREGASSALWAIASPRFLFSVALGFGAIGELLRPVLGGPFLIAAALVGGVLFERVLVSPLWNFTMRFASTPAVTLESAVTDDATAVTSFDANGQGIVSVEVDGQIVQILATLQANDRALGGARIRAGQRVRIEEVNAEKNCCTVSII
jgi:hypothetical protein